MLIFYLIPSYVMTSVDVVLLIFILFNMKKNNVSAILSRRNLNIAKMALKLSFAFGIVDVFAMISIPKRPYSSMSVVVLNHGFTMTYNFVNNNGI